MKRLSDLENTIATVFNFGTLVPKDWIKEAAKYADGLSLSTSEEFLYFAKDNPTFCYRFSKVVDLRLMQKYKDLVLMELDGKDYEDLGNYKDLD